jgi:hypothetical protein
LAQKPCSRFVSLVMIVLVGVIAASNCEDVPTPPIGLLRSTGGMVVKDRGGVEAKIAAVGAGQGKYSDPLAGRHKAAPGIGGAEERRLGPVPLILRTDRAPLVQPIPRDGFIEGVVQFLRRMSE